MKTRRQPTLEELKEDRIILKYLVRDALPEKGLRRMTYYSSLASRPKEVYFMRSYRRPVSDESIEMMMEKKQIIKCPLHISIPFEKDVWVDDEGHIYILKGYAPWDDQPANWVWEPDELNPQKQLVDKIKIGAQPHMESPQM